MQTMETGGVFRNGGGSTNWDKATMPWKQTRTMGIILLAAWLLLGTLRRLRVKTMWAGILHAQRGVAEAAAAARTAMLWSPCRKNSSPKPCSKSTNHHRHLGQNLPSNIATIVRVIIVLAEWWRLDRIGSLPVPSEWQKAWKHGIRLLELTA